MSSADRDLFLHWPELKARLPCIPLADLPTPVLPLSGIHAQCAWVKCDNLSHSTYGGNKIRKLEFVLPQLLKNDIDHVITLGGVGSNSAVAVAMMCQMHQLKCTVFVFDQPRSVTVKKNLQLMAAYGAELIYTRTAVMAGLRYYLNFRRLDSKTVFLWAGCSNVQTVFAYINAAIELKKQIDAGLCPAFDSLFVPVGSSSTVAGLTLGCALLDLPIVVKGVRVAPSHVGPIPACTTSSIAGLMKGALEVLVDACPQYKNFVPPTPILLDAYYGEDYGLNTPEAERAIQIGMEREGLLLEQTYTGKAFAAFLDEIGENNGTHLFWNTHNSRDMQGVLQGCNMQDVPASLRNYITP